MAIFRLNYLNQVQIAANTLSRNRAKSIIQRFLRIADYFSVTTDYLLGVVKSKTINVSTLTDSQIEAVHHMISEFNKANK